jgi:hypothetical protein
MWAPTLKTPDIERAVLKTDGLTPIGSSIKINVLLRSNSRLPELHPLAFKVAQRLAQQ